MVTRSWTFVLALLVTVALTCQSSLQADDVAKTEKASPAEPREADEEYYELMRLFADTIEQVDSNYVKEIDRRELMEAAIRGVLTKLDPYSNYIPPADLERFRSGIENEFGGIGIQVSVDKGQLRIISPLIGTPGYRAGLMAGDNIIKIEGKSTKGITLDGAIKQLKGKVGTEVTFTVFHPHSKKEETVTVKRAMVKVSTVLGDERNKDDSWDFMVDDEHRIGYVRITAFSRHTMDDLKKAVNQLTEDKMRGLVIDLRFNPGGLLTSAVDISNMFIPEGKIVSTKGRNTPERERRATKAGTYEGFPMAILVNRYSASASEIVSACLQDHERAVVIGERTWGKGSVQNIIQLEAGKSALKLTTASYHRPSGANIHRFPGAKDTDVWGVTPNDGYLMKLASEEMSNLLDYRRDRDIVQGKNEDTSEPSDFVDRQLTMAYNYLAVELGDKKPEEKKPEEPTDKEAETAKKDDAKPSDNENKDDGQAEKSDDKKEEPKKDDEADKPNDKKEDPKKDDEADKPNDKKGDEKKPEE